MFSTSKSIKFSLFLLVSANIFSISSAFDCNLIPTSFWCINSVISHQCHVDDQCSAHQSAYRNRPIQLTLLYEALCDGCQQFILDMLEPKIYQPLKNIVDIQLNGSIVCQHGESECYLNKLESCAIYYLSSKANKGFEFIVCLEGFIRNGTEHATALASCYKQFKVIVSTQQKIRTCVDGPLGTKLQTDAGQLTDLISPEKHNFVPWIVINGVSLASLQDIQQQLDAFICYWYEGDNKQSICKRMMTDSYRDGRVFVSN